MTSSHESPVLLITGITGFFAAHVLDAALADPAAYRIRGTTRDLAKGADARKRLSEEDAARVEIVYVDDLATADLTDVLKDVWFIAHVASPCTAMIQDVEREMMGPAIDGTLNLLRAAAKQATVKRVALTSSILALADYLAAPIEPTRTLTKDSWTEGERNMAPGPSAYSVAKMLAERAAYQFVEEKKPSFILATFQPSLLYGPILQPVKGLDSINATSALFYTLLCSLDSMPPCYLPHYCHVGDAADAHVRWLSSSSAPGQRYPLNGGSMDYAMAVEYISKQYPDLVSRLPKDYKQAVLDKKDADVVYPTIDCSDAVEHLGIKFRDWQACVKDTIDSLLELENRTEATSTS